jgi:hypothetical protein
MLATMIGTVTTASMVSSTDLVGENTTQAEAIVLAQETMEDLRTIPYDSIGASTKNSSGYKVKTFVDDDTPEPGMKTIEVSVTWKWKGANRSYELHTVYTKINKG